MKFQTNQQYPYNFLFYYALSYMCGAIYNNYIPIYLNSIGLNQLKVGLLLSIGPLVAIIAQPLWGIASDRSRTKNGILKLLLIGSAFTIALYPWSKTLGYLIIIFILFNFFQSPVSPLSDTITLEYLEKTRFEFGPIRFAGTTGFAFMALIAGIISRNNLVTIFGLYFLVIILTFMAFGRLPAIKGHQSGGRKVSAWKLLQYPELIRLMAFNFIIQIPSSYFASFFPIYYQKLGASNIMFGCAIFISSMSEFPFLWFAPRFIKKLGYRSLMLLAGSVAAIRWFLFYWIKNPYLVLPLQMLHGLMYIVMAYCLATYINQKVPRELRASGQTFNSLITLNFARIAGTFLGGYLAYRVGLRAIFFYNAVIAMGTVIIFAVIFYFTGSGEAQSEIDKSPVSPAL